MQSFSSNTSSIWLTAVLPYTPIRVPSSLLIAFANSSKVQSAANSACKSSQVTSNCTVGKNAANGNLEVSFTAMAFSSLNINLLQVEVTNLFIADYLGLQVEASLSVNGFPSLSLTPPAVLSKVYAEPISDYGLSFSSSILGQTNTTANLTINCSSQTALQLASITVFIPQ